MGNAITYCVGCTAEISFDAESCPVCGAEQKTDDKRPGSGMPTPPPAGWQAAKPPASPTGYTVEEP
jgi:predicted amidophosphoribosyltransferase